MDVKITIWGCTVTPAFRLPEQDLGVSQPFSFLLEAFRVVALAAMVLVLCWQTTVSAADLEKYLPKVEASALFNEADTMGKPQGEPPIAPLMKRGEVIGYAYLNSDFTSARGQRLTEVSNFDSRLPFGGSLGRTDRTDG